MLLPVFSSRHSELQPLMVGPNSTPLLSGVAPGIVSSDKTSDANTQPYLYSHTRSYLDTQAHPPHGHIFTVTLTPPLTHMLTPLHTQPSQIFRNIRSHDVHRTWELQTRRQGMSTFRDSYILRNCSLGHPRERLSSRASQNPHGMTLGSLGVIGCVAPPGR